MPLLLPLPNPNDRLAPSLPLFQIIQPFGNVLQPIVHFVKDGRVQLFLREQSHQFVPDLSLLGRFVFYPSERRKRRGMSVSNQLPASPKQTIDLCFKLTRISSPVNPDDRDVFQQDQVGRDLFDRSRCESDDNNTGFPPHTFQAGYDEALYGMTKIKPISPGQTSSNISKPRETHDRVVDHIHPLPTRDLHHLLLPILCRIIDSVIRSTLLDADLTF